MFESLWIEFNIQIVPFLPQLFTFALIVLPIGFLIMVGNDSEGDQKLQKNS